MTVESFAIPELVPVIRQQRLIIDELQRENPQAWPPDDVNLVEWRTRGVKEIMRSGYVPPKVDSAPSLFIAVLTELCTEVRSGVLDAESEWTLHPNCPDTRKRIQDFTEALDAAVEYTQTRRVSSTVEREVRGLYAMHMLARGDVMRLLMREDLDIAEKRQQLEKLRSAIRDKEIQKAQQLPELMKRVFESRVPMSA